MPSNFKAQQKLEFDRWRIAIAIVERMREAGNMRGLVAAVLSIVFGVVALGIPAQEARSIDRLAKRATDKLPMNFILRHEAPAENCGAKCRLLVVATGIITAETPRQFALFAKAHDVTRATVVLNSEGGSVDGAIALGRAIRQFGLDTTVGRVIDLKDEQQNTARAELSSDAECNSMCAFVLMAGLHRLVRPQARVRVHGIWLGDRRKDAQSASYSADDLALVQRDIGQLVQYTSEIGGSMELLELALRIPPWEPMHRLTGPEVRSMRIDTNSNPPLAKAAEK
ncbi:MAG: hypothetical protein WA703_12915 [Pseudolabrys sp.]